MPAEEQRRSTKERSSMEEETRSRPKPSHPSDNGNSNGSKVNNNKLQKNASSKKKKKAPSPFRIKVGYVVALRYRSEGNDITSVTDSTEGQQQDENGNHSDAGGVPSTSSQSAQSLSLFSEIWADPLPGRDEGLGLIGRRVRCCFPKSILSDSFKHKSTTRYLEGEVVCIPNYEMQLEQQRSGRRKRQAKGLKVDLLVDRDRLNALPFLKRSEYDPEVDISKLSESGKRNYKTEQLIKGEDKVSVQVILGDYMMKDMKHDNILEARWVIRKRVPVKKRQVNKRSKGGGGETTPKKSSSPVPTDEANGNIPNQEANGGTEVSPPSSSKRRKVAPAAPPKDFYIGNGYDSKTQQQANWRWQSSRYEYINDNSFSDNNYDILRDNAVSAATNFVGEVVKIQPSPAGSASKTLATVTLKRLFLPEHTGNGRLSHHKSCEVFDDCNYNKTVSDNNEDSYTKISVLFQAPIEQLVIMSRKLNRPPDSSDDTKLEKITEALEATKSYSSQRNIFFALNNRSDEEDGANGQQVEVETECCCRCKKITDPPHQQCFDSKHTLCEFCQRLIHVVQTTTGDDVCDGSSCHSNLQEDRLKKFRRGVERTVAKQPRLISDQMEKIPGPKEATFPLARCLVRVMNRSDFSFTDRRDPIPSLKINIKKPAQKIRSPKSKKTTPVSDVTELVLEKAVSVRRKNGDRDKPVRATKRCSRTMVYDKSKKRFGSSIGDEYRDRIRNKRLLLADPSAVAESENKDDKALNSRAARASQRRLLKDVSVLGVGLDTMAGREQMLRFDRSKVHGWGVYADVDIKEGEMVIEYRGEIVGNAVCEAREIEYEKTKLGLDYMFRVDNNTVCDATKQGNVARFINAACTPNCSAKIITIEGAKRIAVYAKRDIASGEELYYDYKFPLEYDEDKRIPCRCLAKECRGYLNWVSEKIMSLSQVECASILI